LTPKTVAQGGTEKSAVPRISLAMLFFTTAYRYRRARKDPGFPLNSMAGMTALWDLTTAIFKIAESQTVAADKP